MSLAIVQSALCKRIDEAERRTAVRAIFEKLRTLKEEVVHQIVLARTRTYEETRIRIQQAVASRDIVLRDVHASSHEHGMARMNCVAEIATAQADCEYVIQKLDVAEHKFYKLLAKGYNHARFVTVQEYFSIIL